MKILLLGGTGVLSLDIAVRCLELGFETYTLTRGHHNDELPKGIIPIIGNIRESQLLINSLGDKNFDVVVDFLSYNPEQLKSSLNVFSSRCKQYIFISSCCSYRRAKEDFPIKENSAQPNPELNYGIQKYNGELFIKGLKDLECTYTIVRPYITYGDTRIPYGIAPTPRKHWTIIGRILANKPLFVWSEGAHIPICTLLHTKDFAYAFCKLFMNPKAFNQDVNIVGNQYQSWLEVAKTIARECGNPEVEVKEISCTEVAEYLPEYKEFLRGDRNLDAVFDNSKMLEIIPEFGDTISLSEGISRTIDSYKTHKYYDGVDYAFDGAVDRMLSKYGCKNLKFVDYTGSASYGNRIIYLAYRHLSNNNAKRALNLIVRLKRLFSR